MIRLLLLFTLLLTACAPSATPEQPSPQPSPRPERGFARGADISWCTQLEAEGHTLRNAAGEQRECTALMQELGMDAIRLRVWVDPEGGWCGKEDVVEKALRAHRLGMRLMIDFHYSDSWADPGKQTPPHSWQGCSLTETASRLKAHTREVLQALKERGIEVEWIQIGNETSNGMLWPLGQCDLNPQGYATLHNAGVEAARAIYPAAKVVVHLPNGHDASLYHWLLGELEREGGRYDLIGMSLYPAPAWQTMAEGCLSNIRDLHKRFGKRSVICEVGMPWDDAEGCYAFLGHMLHEAEATGCCEGLFYWEPEAPAGYNGGYTLGAFANGQPTHALDAFGE